MTDEQIVEALECCGNMGNCKEQCPFGDFGGIDKCIHSLMLYALDLINSQKAEIERYKGVIRLLESDVADARADAVREFAEKLKAREQWEVEYREKIIFTSDINNLVKEMTEEEK